jgi:hypothetical protein
MEQRAVDNGSKSTVVAGERADVGDFEGCPVQAALGGFGTGQFDGDR